MNLLGNSARSARVVAGEHVHLDARSVASFDGVGRLRAWRIVQADEAAKREIALNLLSRGGSVTRRTSAVTRIKGSASKCKNPQTLGSQCFHDLKCFVLRGGGKFHGFAIVPADGNAGVQDSLDRAFGVDSLSAGLVVFEYHRHLLNVGIEGVFTDLF